MAPTKLFSAPNMTTLTFAIVARLGRELEPGDEIVVDAASITTPICRPGLRWKDGASVVRWAEILDETDCTLDMADFASKINQDAQLVAVGYASNAVGTINE